MLLTTRGLSRASTTYALQGVQAPRVPPQRTWLLASEGFLLGTRGLLTLSMLLVHLRFLLNRLFIHLKLLLGGCALPDYQRFLLSGGEVNDHLGTILRGCRLYNQVGLLVSCDGVLSQLQFLFRSSRLLNHLRLLSNSRLPNQRRFLLNISILLDHPRFFLSGIRVTDHLCC